MIRCSSRTYGMSLGLFALLLFSSAALAKGVPTEVEITGPGIATPIRETNPLALPALSLDGFMETSTMVAPPADDTPAYEMTRDGGERVRFYPNLRGNFGIIFYIGDPGRIGTEFDNHWYRATGSGDAVFRAVLAMHGIAVPGDPPNLVQLAQGATTSAERPSVRAGAPWPRWLLPLTGIVGMVVGLCVARVIPKRASSRNTRDDRTAPG